MLFPAGPSGLSKKVQQKRDQEGGQLMSGNGVFLLFVMDKFLTEQQQQQQQNKN